MAWTTPLLTWHDRFSKAYAVLREELWEDEEAALTPVFSVITAFSSMLVLSASVLLLASLQPWLLGLGDSSELPPNLQVKVTPRSDGDVIITVIFVSHKVALQDMVLQLYDGEGRWMLADSLGLKWDSPEGYQGLDITWYGQADKRGPAHGGAYLEPDAAETRMTEIFQGKDDTGTSIPVWSADNDFDGKLSVGDLLYLDSSILKEMQLAEFKVGLKHSPSEVQVLTLDISV